MSENQRQITVDEFRTRLASLCLKTGQPGMPRKRRDQHIVLKSVALILVPNARYSETEINERLMRWRRTVARGLEIDHVTLRRYLVDEGYVQRDRDGTSYRTAPSAPQLFDPEVEDLDPREVVSSAELRRIEKKIQYMTDDDVG